MATKEADEPAVEKAPDEARSIPVDTLILTYSNDIESSLQRRREPDNTVTTLEIHKCPSTLTASKLVYDLEFLSSIFTQFPSVVAIKVKIDKDFVPELVDKPVVAEFQGRTAADIAWRKKSQNLLLELLKANSTYPKDFSETEASQEVWQFLASAVNMHAAIIGRDEAQIVRIISENPDVRHFYTAKNVSALTKLNQVAVNNDIDRSSLYELLATHNITYGPGEDIKRSIQFLDDDILKKIRQVYSETAKPLDDSYVRFLQASSVTVHEIDKQKLDSLVKEAFEVLNECPISRQLLQIAATHKNIKIHFNSRWTSVQAMDPMQCPKTSGASYLKKGHIYVAAKELLVSATKLTAIAVLDHEICHLVLYMVFRNDGKPYAIGDAVNEAKFAEIIGKCKASVYNEVIVSSVFEDYEEEQQAAELIVRVPQLLIHYSNDPTKLAEIMLTFGDLFSYWLDVVQPAITAALPVFQKLTIPSIDIKFSDLSDTLKAVITHEEVNFQGEDVKLKDLAENTEILNELPETVIRSYFENEKICIGRAQEEASDVIERNFLALDSQSTTVSQDNEGLSLESIIPEVNNSKVFLLFDRAGAGKSTTMKQLRVKLKQKFPTFWVEYVNLKRHLTIYDRFEKQLVNESKSNETTDGEERKRGAGVV